MKITINDIHLRSLFHVITDEMDMALVTSFPGMVEITVSEKLYFETHWSTFLASKSP